jgi:hypothetical protein
MTNQFRNLLVPTEENKREPSLLSFNAFIVLLVLGLVIISLPFGMSRYQMATLVSPLSFSAEDMIRLTNEARIKVGLNALKQNNLLTNAADAKAVDMVTKGYFAHVSPDNKTPFDFIHDAGYDYYAAGENLALDFVSADDVQNALMNSLSHRTNILNKLYTDIGTAVVSGTYQNHPATFVVEYFGTPPKNTTQLPKTTSIPATQKESTSSESSKKPIVTVPQESTAVLGVQDSTGTQIVAETGLQTSDGTFGVVVRYLSFGLIFMLIVSFVLSILRKGNVTSVLIARTLILLIVFGYIGFYGIAKANFSTLTIVSFSEISQSLK